MSWSNSWPKKDNEVGVEGWLQKATDKAVESLKPDYGYEVKQLQIWSFVTDEFKSAEVTIVNDLGIYRAFEAGDKGWKVLHLPTMTKMNKAVPEGLHAQKALISWCEKVQAELKDDWTELRARNHDNYDEETPALMDAKLRIKEWCLSVKVE